MNTRNYEADIDQLSENEERRKELVKLGFLIESLSTEVSLELRKIIGEDKNKKK